MPANYTSSSRSRTGSSQDGTINPRSYGDMNPLDQQPFGNQGYDDGWYYSQIEQFRETDPDFYQYLLTNPHLISNSGNYTPYWTEQLFGTADTSAARYYNQLKSDANEWLSRALSEHHVENYSDPLQEVARRKAAGLNDDLSGGAQIGSGEPANPGKSEIDSQLPNVGDPASPESVINIGTNLINTALQFYEGLQGLRSMSLDNRIKSLTVGSKIHEMSWNIIQEGVSEYMSSNPAPSKEDLNDPSFVNLLPSSISKTIGERVYKLPYSHRDKRAISKTMDELIYAFDEKGNKVPTAKYQALINSELKHLADSRSELAESYGKPGAQTEDVIGLKFIANEVYKPINDLALKLMKDNYKLQLSSNKVAYLQNRFDTDYLKSGLSEGLPGVKAGAEFASLSLQKDLKNVQNRITSVFEEINKKVLGNPTLSANWKMAIQAGLAVGESLFMSRLAQGGPSLSIGTTNSKTGAIGLKSLDL